MEDGLRATKFDKFYVKDGGINVVSRCPKGNRDDQRMRTFRTDLVGIFKEFFGADAPHAQAVKMAKKVFPNGVQMEADKVGPPQNTDAMRGRGTGRANWGRNRSGIRKSGMSNT